ncbi:MAG: hypothetical protein AAB506_00785 [Patescibacteria group bacterium]
MRTIEIFLKRAKGFEKKNPEEARHLMGELLAWGSAVGESAGGGSLGDLIARQIDSVVDRSNGRITATDFVNGLFSPNPRGEITADVIMGRFQLW